jgi:hypothetical protein
MVAPGQTRRNRPSVARGRGPLARERLGHGQVDEGEVPGGPQGEGPPDVRDRLGVAALVEVAAADVLHGHGVQGEPGSSRRRCS